MEDFWNLLIGLPKCRKGGRCNQDKQEDDYNVSTMFNKVFNHKKYYCTKCNKDTSEYGKI